MDDAPPAGFRLAGREILVSLAVLIAVGYHLAVVAGVPGTTFWAPLAVMLVVVVLGLWLERSLGGTPDGATPLLIVALASAGLALAAWRLVLPDDPAFIVERVVAVLVVASPGSLGLARRMAVDASAARLTRDGIRAATPTALDRLGRVDIVLFDTAGTLTTGEAAVRAVVPSRSWTAPDVLALAASVEFESEHPVARAIVAYAREASVTVAPPTGFTSLAGRGVRAAVDGREVLVGNVRLLAEQGLRLDDALRSAAHSTEASGATVVVVIVGGEVAGIVSVEDPLRPESAEAIARLRAHGVRAALVTGGSLAVADWMAVRLGLDEVFASMLPDDRADLVSRLQQRGARVAVVGEGVADAAALAAADVGIAIGAGADSETDVDIVLGSDDPRGVAAALDTSRAMRRARRRTLAVVVTYHALVIPLAAAVLSGVGVTLPLALAAALPAVLLGAVVAVRLR